MTHKCIHCGAIDENGKMVYWPGVMGWECHLIPGGVPACKEGQQWYAEHTRVEDGVREYVEGGDELENVDVG